MMVPVMWRGVPEEYVVEEFVVPAQLNWGWRCPLTPERRLAFAVLWSAVSDLMKYRFATRRRHQRLYWNAWEWVAAANDGWGFSFERLCEEFKLDAAEARSVLLEMRKPASVLDLVGDSRGKRAEAPLGSDIDHAA